MRPTTIGAAILFAMLPFAALAQSVPPSSASQPEAASPQRSEARAKMRAACGSDIQKFCATVERGKGAMRSCLESHQSDLSATCKAARAERAAARAKDRS
jgi:Cysteine rich repeat